jgi:hypothetical protein
VQGVQILFIMIEYELGHIWTQDVLNKWYELEQFVQLVNELHEIQEEGQETHEEIFK